MTNAAQVIQAESTLRAALLGEDAEQCRAAIEAIEGLMATFYAMAPAKFARAFQSAHAGSTEEDSSTKDFVLSIIEAHAELPARYFHLLLRVLLPSWVSGGEMRSSAPSFEEVKEKLLKPLDSGIIDFEGYAAVFIGRYGPEAASVLPELLERLRRNRTDCSKAPGLTWAVYQIGGVRPAVLEVLLEVARREDSCPHAQPLARQILEMNEISWEEEAA